MRRNLTTALDLLGLACLVACAFFIWPPRGARRRWRGPARGLVVDHQWSRVSIFFNRAATMTAGEMIADRTRGRRTGGGNVSSSTSARRVSAWWAAQRLRADLISTMPVDVFRRVGGVQVQQKKGPLFITPEGSGSLWCEWMYSTTIDLDSVGNTVGIISAVDGFGLPSVIELQPSSDVTVRCSKSGVVDYKIGAKTYKSSQIWHEKQHTVSGSPVGLSPLAHAALALNPGLSAAQFALDWFQNSTVPAAHLRNSARTLNADEATTVKGRFKASMRRVTCSSPAMTGSTTCSQRRRPSRSSSKP
jgi:hypothetical protein